MVLGGHLLNSQLTLPYHRKLDHYPGVRTLETLALGYGDTRSKGQPKTLGEEMGPGYYLTTVTHELLFVLSVARDDKKLKIQRLFLYEMQETSPKGTQNHKTKKFLVRM